MPIFEYKCRKCGAKFDYLLLSAHQEPPVCPQCGTRDPIKQVSSFSTSGSSRGTGAAAPT